MKNLQAHEYTLNEVKCGLQQFIECPQFINSNHVFSTHFSIMYKAAFDHREQEMRVVWNKKILLIVNDSVSNETAL